MSQMEVSKKRSRWTFSVYTLNNKTDELRDNNFYNCEEVSEPVGHFSTKILRIFGLGNEPLYYL